MCGARCHSEYILCPSRYYSQYGECNLTILGCLLAYENNCVICDFMNNYYWVNRVCVLSLRNNVEQLSYKSDTILKCKSSNALFIDSTNYDYCEDSSCFTLGKDNKTCTSCRIDYAIATSGHCYYYQGNCTSYDGINQKCIKCENPYYLLNGACLGCSNNCKYCQNSTCIARNSEHYLLNGACISTIFIRPPKLL